MSESALKYFSQINTENLRRFEKRSVYFTRPRLVALYDVNHGKLSTAKKLKYFRLPAASEYPINLNRAYNTYRFRESFNKDEKVTAALKPLMDGRGSSADDGRSDDRKGRTAVCTRRGTLRYIMQFCYKVPNDLTLLVSRQNGRLYMFEHYADSQESMQGREFTHHGCLLQHLFVDNPKELLKCDEPFDDNVSILAVHRASLGNFDITYTGEAQGILSDERVDIGEDINALSQRHRFVLTKQIWSDLRRNDTKFLSYWLQAYLADVDDMYLAYKDDQGVVHNPIEHIKVSNMPKDRYWKPGICTAFLNEFLERVVQLMWNVNSFQTVYEFRFIAKDKTIHYQIHEDNPEKILIPNEFIQFITKEKC